MAIVQIWNKWSMRFTVIMIVVPQKPSLFLYINFVFFYVKTYKYLQCVDTFTIFVQSVHQIHVVFFFLNKVLRKIQMKYFSSRLAVRTHVFTNDMLLFGSDRRHNVFDIQHNEVAADAKWHLSNRMVLCCNNWFFIFWSFFNF